jgi:eukaryotic-like serine/threonine-protein kinase
VLNWSEELKRSRQQNKGIRDRESHVRERQPTWTLAIDVREAIFDGEGRGHLKPANIIQDRSASAKILDFGLAKFLDSDAEVTRTADGIVGGTVAYMSPEQAEGLPVDERSDIFSFGAVLYELLTGRRAFDGTTTGTK